MTYDIITHMLGAVIFRDYHQIFPNGPRVDIVIWRLPNTTVERPHGFKCRLNYGLSDGSSLVRYDNETGKGDHKHVRNKQFPYTFSTVSQLFKDFASDVISNGGTLSI